MNRGSARRSRWSCSLLRRFNEAPIHESGKLRGVLMTLAAQIVLQ